MIVDEKDNLKIYDVECSVDVDSKVYFFGTNLYASPLKHKMA